MSIALACNGSAGSVNNVIEVGIFSNVQPVVTGDTPPDTWSVTAGALPPGMTLDTVHGTIGGTCNSIGTYYYTLKVVDSTTATTTVNCSISVVPTKYGGTQYNPATGFWALISASMEVDQGSN